MKMTERFERVDINKLVGYARNARTHSKEQVLKLRSSLREFGFVNPIIVDKDLNIIAGHGRVLAAKAEGLTEVPCVFAEHLTEAQRKAYILVDNRSVLDAGWDDEMLALEFGDLKELGFDLELTGFDAIEIEKLFAADAGDVQDDDFDIDNALKEEPFVKQGDLWRLGKHRLLCGDSTKPEDVARLMDGKKANMCLTDAPYNVSYDKSKHGKIMNDDLPKEEFYNFLLTVFINVYENLADGGAFYCFHSDSEKANFFNACVNAGFHYSTTCVWVKDSLVLGRLDYQQRHEPCMYGWKPTASHKFYGDRKQTSVWEFPRPKKSEYHSTQKPIPLMAYPIGNSTQTNSIVLEPFSGSFSTGMACEQLGRICYAIELDPKFASASIRRFAESYDAEQITVERDGKIYGYSDLLNDMEDAK